MPKCSIVIPVYNEASHIEDHVSRFWRELGSARDLVAEIWLVENGSTDGSYDACQRLARLVPSILRIHQVSFPSYGEAVRQGVLRATAEVTMILESDAMDIDFFHSALAHLESGTADFVVGSKRHPQSIDSRPYKRRLLTRLFNLWLKVFFRFPGTDTHGLKAIRTEVARHLCGFSITRGEVFQTEIVLLAHKLSYRVVEVPVHLNETRRTRVSIVRRLPKVIGIVGELKKSLDRFC
jgi:glycosyltransferase involved in cell wall biosynthesis